jgi:hypothetical protein
MEFSLGSTILRMSALIAIPLIDGCFFTLWCPFKFNSLPLERYNGMSNLG